MIRDHLRADFIKFICQCPIVGLKRIDNPPTFLEVALLNGFLGIVTFLNNDRNNTRTDRLVFTKPNSPSNRLDDIDVTTPRINKSDAINNRCEIILWLLSLRKVSISSFLILVELA